MAAFAVTITATGEKSGLIERNAVCERIGVPVNQAPRAGVAPKYEGDAKRPYLRR